MHSRARKKSGKQLECEIGEVLAGKSVGKPDTGGMERVTRERVLEPLAGERITRTDDVQITLLPLIGTRCYGTTRRATPATD